MTWYDFLGGLFMLGSMGVLFLARYWIFGDTKKIIEADPTTDAVYDRRWNKKYGVYDQSTNTYL